MWWQQHILVNIDNHRNNNVLDDIDALKFGTLRRRNQKVQKNQHTENCFTILFGR